MKRYEIVYCLNCDHLEYRRQKLEGAYWCYYERPPRRIGIMMLRPSWCFCLATAAPTPLFVPQAEQAGMEI